MSAHSAIEVGVGLAIGIVALGVFARGYLSRPPVQARLPPLLLAVVLMAVALPGSNLRAEEILYALSDYCGSAGWLAGE